MVNIAAPALRTARPRKPLLVFDMALPSKNGRTTTAVSGAAFSLATSLRRAKVATPYFMQTPFAVTTKGRRISFPKQFEAESRPLIFALTLYDSYFAAIQEEVRAIKQFYPEARILIGGPSVNTCTDLKELAQFFPEATALVKGDGEEVLIELAQTLAREEIDWQKIETLNGLYIQEAGREYCNETASVLNPENFNDLPGITAYPVLIQDIKARGSLEISTSRSCKYRCVFCSHKYHQQPLYWTAERITEELFRIKDMIKKGILPGQARWLCFNDDDFFQDTERAIRFLEIVADDPSLGKYFGFDFQGSVGSFFIKKKINVELLDLLARLKYVHIGLGTDGFHPHALKHLRKGGYTWAMAQELMAQLYKREIPQQHYVILTYPDLTPQILYETAENILDLLEQYKNGFSLSFSFFLVGDESNGLLKKYGLADYRTVKAGDKTRSLPLGLPMNDGRFYAFLRKFAYSTAEVFFSRRMLRKSIALASDRAFRKKMKKFAKFLRYAKKAEGRIPQIGSLLCNNCLPDVHYRLILLLEDLLLANFKLET